MELIIGIVVICLVVMVWNAIERAILRSKSPVVHGVVRAVGTVAAASIARDIYNSKRRKK